MHMHLNQDAQVNTVTFYDSSRIVFGTQSYTSTILASKDTIRLWSVTDVEAIADRGTCQPILEQAPSLLVVGEGQVRRYAADVIFAHIIAAKIPFELMTLSSAIKTYNAAVLEGRNVLGAFILS